MASDQVLLDDLRFFALGDFGYNCAETRQVARAMQNWAATEWNGQAPHFILGLGDIIYPTGANDVSDSKFKQAWRDVFLIPELPLLHVPWKFVLGNHDWLGNPEAYVELTSNRQYNPDGLWQLPSIEPYSFSFDLKYRLADSASEESDRNDPLACSIPKQLSSSSTASALPLKVQFFGFDSNGVQNSVRRARPSVEHDLRDYLRSLDQMMRDSTADVKIVFAHHPMYTQGRHHSMIMTSN